MPSGDWVAGPNVATILVRLGTCTESGYRPGGVADKVEITEGKVEN